MYKSRKCNEGQTEAALRPGETASSQGCFFSEPLDVSHVRTS